MLYVFMIFSGKLWQAISDVFLPTSRNVMISAFVSTQARIRASSCVSLTGVDEAMKTSLTRGELVGMIAR